MDGPGGLRRRRFGEESVKVAQSLRNVGLARLALDDRKGARLALDRSVELSREVYPERHPRLAEALAARAELERAEGDAAAARRDLEEALAIREEKFGTDNPLTAAVRAELAKLAEAARGTHRLETGRRSTSARRKWTKAWRSGPLRAARSPRASRGSWRPGRRAAPPVGPAARRATARGLPPSWRARGPRSCP